MILKPFFPIVILAFVILFVGFSCSKNNNASSANTPPPYTPPSGATTVTISMYNMAFSPSTTTVTKGTIIKWVNNDYYDHWPLSNDGGATFDSGGAVSEGGSYSYTTINTGGVPDTIAYHCYIHGLAMSGTLIVKP